MNRSKRLWVFYFCLIMMCLPNNEKYPAILDRAISFSCYIGYLLAIYVFIKLRYYQRKILYPLYAWFAWAILSTILNASYIVGIMVWSLPLICSAVLAVYLLDHDRDFFFERISWIFTALLVVQAFSLYTHCFGTHFQVYRYVPYYFFGIRIAINPIIPFAVFFGLLAYQYGKRRSPLSFVISTACGLYFVITLRVSTSLVGYTIMFIMFLVIKNQNSEHFVRNIAILSVLFTAGFMFLYSGESQLENWFFNDLLEEGVSLNQRTIIWTQAINQMKGIHWIVGYGYGNGLSFRVNSKLNVTSVHNQYLSTVVNYGLIGLSIYILMCIRQVKTIGAKKIAFSERVFYSVFIAMIFMQIPAALYGRPFYYIFYAVSLYLPSFDYSAIAENRIKHKKIVLKFGR